MGEDDAPYSAHIIGAFGVTGVNDLGEQVCPDKKERARLQKLGWSRAATTRNGDALGNSYDNLTTTQQNAD